MTVEPPGRPRRPELTRDPAPIAEPPMPAAAKTGLRGWTGALIGLLVALAASILFVGEARTQLEQAYGDGSGKTGQAVSWLINGLLGALALLGVLELFVLTRVRRRRRGARIVLSLLGLATAASLPTVADILAGPPWHGTIVRGALWVAGGSMVLSTLVLWLPPVTRWLRRR